ncbi:hypothetical protein [Methyloglobulus sp.]|uniref:hypothetical protein n=1 Tax=Methyloglobulus sp. TaxID=2518622 RepID=UPI0032B77F1E
MATQEIVLTFAAMYDANLSSTDLQSTPTLSLSRLLSGKFVADVGYPMEIFLYAW